MHVFVAAIGTARETKRSKRFLIWRAHGDTEQGGADEDILRLRLDRVEQHAESKPFRTRLHGSGLDGTRINRERAVSDREYHRIVLDYLASKLWLSCCDSKKELVSCAEYRDDLRSPGSRARKEGEKRAMKAEG